MRLSGCVVYTGKSSVVVSMDAQCHGQPQPWLEASFTFVARDMSGGDKETGRAFPVNQLQPESPEEQRLFDSAADKAKLRKELATTSGSASGGPPHLHTSSARCAAPSSVFTRARRVVHALHRGVVVGGLL
jgi:hypothetical protein